MTAEQLLQYSHEPYKQELVDGMLDEMQPTGAEHGSVSAEIGHLLTRHVKNASLGRVFASEAGSRLASDPDIPKGFWPGPPDLAVEVVSHHDRPSNVEAKARDWIAAGTRVVIVVDPPSRTVTVFLGSEDVRTLHAGDRLDLGDVVPGWSPRVADFFV
jgi:Uma2 family endonuclease